MNFCSHIKIKWLKLYRNFLNYKAMYFIVWFIFFEVQLRSKWASAANPTSQLRFIQEGRYRPEVAHRNRQKASTETSITSSSHSVSMEMAVSISSLGGSSLSRSSLPAGRSPQSKRRALRHLPFRRCAALAAVAASAAKMRPRRKRKKRKGRASRATTKGSLRAKGQRREARMWQLLCPPARSVSLPMITRWDPMTTSLTSLSLLGLVALQVVLSYLFGAINRAKGNDPSLKR